MEEFINIIENTISLKDEEIKITADSELVCDLGITSLDMMMLICELEHKYNKEISIEKLIEAKTISDLYAIVTL